MVLTDEQLERAERVARMLEAGRSVNKAKLVLALDEASRWKSDRSLSTGAKAHSVAATRGEYTFTDEQFRIALASLERQESK